MVPFILALVSIPITATLADLLYFPFVALERRIQWKDKSQEEWEALGVEDPGSRLSAVSFFSGVIGHTINKTAAIVVAARIFHAFNVAMPLLFLLVVGILMIPNDLGRVRRFLGNAGIWTELGYVVGDLIGLTVGAVLASRWIS